MDRKSILEMVDHTLLAPDAAWKDIEQLCDDAIAFHTASICIPPRFVRNAADYVKGRISVCTVVGFPCGYSTTASKEFETREALESGADEIDMVISLGEVKAGRFDLVRDEIIGIKKICRQKILKVIIETCLLTEAEKMKMCTVVTDSGADFIKTSTGFSSGGATYDDIKLFASHVGTGVRIKASGGISTFEEAQRFIELGASRLGTSRLVKLAKNG